jgi:hypothetical protein
LQLYIYAYKYGDGTLAQGILAKETVALTSTSGEKVSIDIVFGCGHNDTGTLNDHEMGIVGLGGGIISFVSQIASTLGNKRFSHCFTPFGTVKLIKIDEYNLLIYIIITHSRVGLNSLLIAEVQFMKI